MLTFPRTDRFNAGSCHRAASEYKPLKVDLHSSYMSEHSEALHIALLSSEIRHIGARIKTFSEQLTPFMISASALDPIQTARLVDLYSRFSAEIDIIEATLCEINGAAEIISPLAAALRTPLEEGILSYCGNEKSEYADPKYIGDALLREYRAHLYRNSRCLPGLAPSTHGDSVPFRVHIAEYGETGQPLSDNQCEELLELTNSRVIDPMRQEPQEGFGRECAPEEFRGFVRRHSTRCFVPSDEHGALGVYLFDSERESIPVEARDIIERSPTCGPLTEKAGWVDAIALTTTARDRMRPPFDLCLIAHAFGEKGHESRQPHPLRDLALFPSAATKVGPGDYILDTKGTLHQITLNSAYGVAHPSAREVISTQERTFQTREIQLYLKKQSLTSRRTGSEGIAVGGECRLVSVLESTSVTEVGPGDFIRCRDDILREIVTNTAFGQKHPSLWEISTSDGRTFSMLDGLSYLKRKPATEMNIGVPSPASLYRWLTLTACQTAVASGLHSLWCQVRIGTQANTAREKHLAVGWEATGLTYTRNGREFEVLRLDPLKVMTQTSDRELPSLKQDHSYAPSGYAQSEYTQRRDLAKNVWMDQRRDHTNDHFLNVFGHTFRFCEVSHSTDLLGRLRVHVCSPAGISVFFQQGLAGYDLWRAQSDSCYSFSLYNPLASLQRTLQRDHDGLCSELLSAPWSPSLTS